LILVTVTLLIPLISFQIGDASYRYLKEYLNSSTKIISTTVFFLLFNLTVFLLVSFFLYYVLEWNEILWFVIICLSSLVVHNLLLIYRGLNLIKSYALLGSLSGIFTLVFILYILFDNPTILNISICFGIGHFIAVVISLWESSILNKIKFRSWNKALFLRLLYYSLPLIPNATSWWLIDLGNRYIIKFTMGEEANGVYAVAARYIVVLAFINGFFLMIWQDYYLSKKATLDHSRERLSTYFKVQTSIILAITSCSYLLIYLGAGDDFLEAYRYLGLICLSSFFSFLSAIVGVEYLKTKKTKFLFTSTLLGGLINVTISLLLVNYFGLYGIAIGSLLGFVSTFIIRVNKSHDLKKVFTFTVKTPLKYLMLFILIYCLQFLENLIVCGLVGIMTIVTLIYHNKKLLLSIIIRK
jgi:O-antigen/teichoic acid export membrane protein